MSIHPLEESLRVSLLLEQNERVLKLCTESPKECARLANVPLARRLVAFPAAPFPDLTLINSLMVLVMNEAAALFAEPINLSPIARQEPAIA